MPTAREKEIDKLQVIKNLKVKYGKRGDSGVASRKAGYTSSQITYNALRKNRWEDLTSGEQGVMIDLYNILNKRKEDIENIK